MNKIKKVWPITYDDDSNSILHNDKKNLNAILIIGIILIALFTLTAFIVGCVLANAGIAFLSLFGGGIMFIALFIAILNSQNNSRNAAALLKMAELLNDDDEIDAQ